jgi:LPPG:FO 2-phospho-L-lactate transferase
MRIVALAGGVGGAKLVDGLAHNLPPQDLTIVVNTGDDFVHLGLSISPDLDTVCYTLGGIANPETGWGQVDETWHIINNLEKLGGPIWFRLGDKDLATHLERSRRLKAGQTLSEITAQFCKAWGVGPTVLPMSDQPVRTIVFTDEGELAFQEYFVARQCEPQVTGFRFEGIQSAIPAPGVLEAIQVAEAVILCPSNPWVSIDPILKVPGILPALHSKVVAAVSPIIGGKALKGPAEKMYTELGITPSAQAVAEHYGELLSGFVIDTTDKELAKVLSLKTLVTDTIMMRKEDRIRLGEEVLSFIRDL